jgi:hypothetical protein
MYADRANEPECELIDFHAPELNLKLSGGIDLVASRPFPNKNYLVACQKLGNNAITIKCYFVHKVRYVSDYPI